MKKFAILGSILIFAVLGFVVIANASVSTISAGSDQSITWPVSTATLSGSATASDGKSIASYAWTQTSGPVVSNIVTPATASTNITGLTTPGEYVYTFTAGDNSNPVETSSTTVKITVNPGITASAGADQTITLPTSSVSLAGTASTSPGNTIASYAWTQTSGPVTATIVSPTSAGTSVTGLNTTGAYVFTLTATNNATPALVATDTVTINVNSITVSAGTNQTITLPTSSASLSGSASTTAGSIASYAWTQVSGPVTATIATPSSASTSVSAMTTAGVYVFKLTAVNNTTPALTGSANVTVTVNPDPSTPVPPVVNTNGSIHINKNGKVKLVGALDSKGTNVMTVKVWGITFTVNTGSAQFVGSATNADQYTVGDQVKVKGTLVSGGSTPVVDATQVKDKTLDQKNKQNDDDSDDDNQSYKEKVKELKKEWKDYKKSHKGNNGKGHGHGKKGGHDD